MESNGKITTLLWDVDGTLLDFDYSMRGALRKCFHTLGKPLTEEMILRYSQINDGYWKRLERGEVTKEELLPGRFRDFFADGNRFGGFPERIPERSGADLCLSG